MSATPTPPMHPTPEALRLLREALQLQRREFARHLATFRAGMPFLGALATDEPSASDVRAILRDLQELAGPFA